MTIQIGQRIPAATLTVLKNGARQTASTDDVFKGRKVVLFGVPGAFTPTCSEQHLPGYVKHFGDFEKRGVDVVCMAVNDAFVLGAWAKSLHVPAGLALLADGSGEFTRALGMELDASRLGMGLRCKRFALYAEDGTVKKLAVEAVPSELRVSSAEAMLAAI